MADFLPVCEPLLAGNELEYVTDAVKTGWISSSGKYVGKFEKAFSAWCGVREGIAVCNGTVALHLALVALGVGPEDEVIVPDFTMIASAAAVCYTGAKPVFADADPQTWNISPEKVECLITPRTKAIMAVHIFGNPCDMTELAAIARKYNIPLMEDAAEAHGATWRGKKAGALSDISAFSFFANKNITTGEGGMVLTDDEALARKCRYYKNVCFPLDKPRNYLHDDIGFNYRMSNLHAAIGLAQTEKADEYLQLRQKHDRMYRERLGDIPGVVMQTVCPEAISACWMHAIALKPGYGHSRDELAAFLKNRGIDTRLLFNGMHRQPALRKFGCDCSGDFSISDFLADNGLYLPSGSALSENDIEHVCMEIEKFHHRSGN